MIQNPLFGLFITLIAYCIGISINRKFKKTILNPLAIAIILIIAFLRTFNISYEDYSKGGNIITLFLAPATASLALSVYRQRKLLKKHFLAIFIGTGVGSLTSVSSIFIMGKFLNLDSATLSSLLPKSVTTPIAIAISTSIGGIPALTVAAVIITGILGSLFSPLFIKLFRIKHPVAKGVGIGACSHALGTSKAIEIGEDIGAMSGISIAFSGLFTVIFALSFY